MALRIPENPREMCPTEVAWLQSLNVLTEGIVLRMANLLFGILLRLIPRTSAKVEILVVAQARIRTAIAKACISIHLRMCQLMEVL